MQLDVEMSPPASVGSPNFPGSSFPICNMNKIVPPSQVSNFTSRGACVAKCQNSLLEALVKLNSIAKKL